MTILTDSPRVPPLSAEEIDDPALQAVLARAQVLSTPKPAWYLTMAHAPDVAVAYAEFWDHLHRGGRLDHRLKELVRITVSTLLGCSFCADQRSAAAVDAGLDEDEVAACAAPDWNHPDPRVRAALLYTRALVLDAPGRDTDWDDIYHQLRSLFDDAEVIELGVFTGLALGMVKLSASLNEASALSS